MHFTEDDALARLLEQQALREAPNAMRQLRVKPRLEALFRPCSQQNQHPTKTIR